MGTPILILGESGSGKSTSLRNLNPDECFLINPENKRLPFKSKTWKKRELVINGSKGKMIGNIIHTEYSGDIITVINNAKKANVNKIIVDDFQYVMANPFMRRRSEKSYEKFTEIGGGAWDVIKAAQDADEDLIVYFMAHTEETNSGRIKIKTIGKMLDEKITIEGMFSIVLRTSAVDGHYYFTTQTDGNDPVKSPMGMFDKFQIDNDLDLVDKTIREYYEI
ncbi:ATP-binding protein [Yersinia frederiksenii]|nr:ATP-binding protein [Yersinia frederiksenii]